MHKTPYIIEIIFVLLRQGFGGILSGCWESSRLDSCRRRNRPRAGARGRAGSRARATSLCPSIPIQTVRRHCSQPSFASLSRAAGNRTQSTRTRIVRTTGILQPVAAYLNRISLRMHLPKKESLGAKAPRLGCWAKGQIRCSELTTRSTICCSIGKSPN